MRMILWSLLKVTVILLAISAIVSCSSSKDAGQTSEPVKVAAVFKQSVPGDSTGFNISRSEINEMEVGSSRESKGTKTTAKLTRTGADSYQVDCSTPPDTVTVYAEVTCPPVIINQPEPKIVYQTPWYIWLLIGGLLAVIVAMGISMVLPLPGVPRL